VIDRSFSDRLLVPSQGASAAPQQVVYQDVNGAAFCQEHSEPWDHMLWPWGPTELTFLRSECVTFTHSVVTDVSLCRITGDTECFTQACIAATQYSGFATEDECKMSVCHGTRDQTDPACAGAGSQECVDVYSGFLHLAVLGSIPVPLTYTFQHGAWPPNLLRMEGSVAPRQLPGITFNVELTVRESSNDPAASQLSDADFTPPGDWHCAENNCACSKFRSSLPWLVMSQMILTDCLCLQSSRSSTRGPPTTAARQRATTCLGVRRPSTQEANLPHGQTARPAGVGAWVRVRVRVLLVRLQQGAPSLACPATLERMLTRAISARRFSEATAALMTTPLTMAWWRRTVTCARGSFPGNPCDIACD